MSFGNQSQSQQEHRQSMGAWLAQACRLQAQSISADVSTKDARHDALSFLQYVMTDDLGQPIEVDTFTRIFVQVWVDCLLQGRHLAFTAPPGLGKSSLARLLMLYSIGKANHLRTVITSADKSDAANAVNLCRGIVLSSAFRDVFPGVEPDIEKSSDAKGWKMGEWYLKTKGQRKDPTMRAWAAQPKGESIRVDMLLADDIVGQKTFEGKVHERIVRAFHNTWIEGRLANGGWCCYLQNVRGADDLLHQLRESPKFCSVWVGVDDSLNKMFVKVWNAPRKFMIKDETKFRLEHVDVDLEQSPAEFKAEFDLPSRELNGERLWTRERLLAIEPTSRQTMYELKGVRSDDLMFPGWITRTKKDATSAQLINADDSNGLVKLNDLDRHRLIIVGGLDISGEHRRGTSFWLIARDREGHKYPLEHWTIKGDLEEVVERIDQAWNRGLRFSLLQVENNGVQSTIQRVITSLARRDQYDWAGRVTPFHTGTNKYDTQLGLPALSVEFQTGTYIWPSRMSQMGQRYQDSPVEKEIGENWTLFESAVSRLTRDSDRKTTPDSVMAFWFADDAFRKTGFTSGNLQPKTLYFKSRKKDIKL